MGGEEEQPVWGGSLSGAISVITSHVRGQGTGGLRNWGTT